jgi:hypothetical protein
MHLFLIAGVEKSYRKNGHWSNIQTLFLLLIPVFLPWFQENHLIGVLAYCYVLFAMW